MVQVGVVAQWQSAGGLGQRPWVRLPVAPPFFWALCCFKGLWIVMAQIMSFIRCHRSSNHRVLSIGLLHCCDSTWDLSLHQRNLVYAMVVITQRYLIFPLISNKLSELITGIIYIDTKVVRVHFELHAHWAHAHSCEVWVHCLQLHG